jgi:glycosyltransferase involved in cell wall biosynthesis
VIDILNILVDCRWIGSHGIGRFAVEILKRLPQTRRLTSGPKPSSPIDPLYLSWILRAKKRPCLFFSPGYNAPLNSPVPFVFNIHDFNHLYAPSNSSALKKLFYQMFILPACHRAYKILTVSEFSKIKILEWSNMPDENVIVVGSGVDNKFSPIGPRYNPGYPYLLYVGNRKPHKNIDRLLKAFAQSKLSDDLKLVMSGEPDIDTATLIKELKLEDRVVFVGLIDDDKLPEFYRGAVAFIFPSLYEGFGLPPLEAMACGTPVLTSNVTSIPEVVGDAALMVDPYDVEAIASGIKRLVEDSQLRKELSQKGIARAKLFSWDKTAELTWKVLKEAIDPGE